MLRNTGLRNLLPHAWHAYQIATDLKVDPMESLAKYNKIHIVAFHDKYGIRHARGFSRLDRAKERLKEEKKQDRWATLTTRVKK